LGKCLQVLQPKATTADKVTSHHKGDASASWSNFKNSKSISCNTTHPQSWNRQAMFMGETLRGSSKSREARRLKWMN